MKKVRNIIIAVVLIFSIGALIDYFYVLPQNEHIKPSDKLIIKDGKGEVLLTIEQPSLSVERDVVGVALINRSDLKLQRFSMKVKYQLVFLKNDEVLATYKVLTPKNAKKVKRIDKLMKERKAQWFTMNGEYVILNTNFTYFTFSKDFFDRLGKMIEEGLDTH